MQPAILVIAHEATRTGSPRVLIDLLTQLRGRLPLPIAMRLLAEGPLGAELRGLADVDRHAATPRLALVNSAAAAGELWSLPSDVPAVAYLHEERDALAVLGPDSTRALAERCDTVLCVSERSREGAVEIGVPVERTHLLPPAVRQRADGEEAPALPGGYDLDPTLPLVLGCGEAGWRKGADLFVDVARRVTADRDAQFVWAGRRPRAFGRVLDNDTTAAGVDGRLHWLGEVDDVRPLYAAATVLVMASREDPQPLVPLEAAAWGAPTAGFAVGGLVALAAEGAADAVPYPDTPALAALVGELLDDGGRRRTLAGNAAGYAAANHSIERLADRLLEVLTDVLHRGTT